MQKITNTVLAALLLNRQLVEIKLQQLKHYFLFVCLLYIYTTLSVEPNFKSHIH